MKAKLASINGNKTKSRDNIKSIPQACRSCGNVGTDLDLVC